MDGFSIPFSDSPIDGEPVGHQLYLDIIYQAKKYVYIMTPYLVLDDDMITALTYAAKRGVDTVIIMPHIPDKKVSVHAGPLLLYGADRGGGKNLRVPAGVCPLKDVCQRWGESCGWIRQYGFQKPVSEF